MPAAIEVKTALSALIPTVFSTISAGLPSPRRRTAPLPRSHRASASSTSSVRQGIILQPR